MDRLLLHAKLTDQDAAVADAQALVANDAPVGTPALPIFSREQLAQSDAWVGRLRQRAAGRRWPGSRDNIFDQPLVPEPPSHAQEMYALLDTVVQTVLTDKNADIAALLAQADADADGARRGLIGARTRANVRRVPGPARPSVITPPRRPVLDGRRGGASASDGRALSTFVMALPMLLVFTLLRVVAIVRAGVMSVQHTNLVDTPCLRRPGQLPARCSPTRCCGPP